MHLAADPSKHRNRTADKWRLCAYAAIFFSLTLFVSLFFPLSKGSIDQAAISCSITGKPRFPWSEKFGFPADMAQGVGITLGSGNFTFTEAKGIDIAWDLTVGRGGQLLVTYLSYPVFRGALLLAMEERAVTFQVFGALTLEAVSFTSMWTLLKASCAREKRRLRSDSPRWRWFLLLFAFAYIFTFPTWLSAMTGYQSKSEAYFRPPLTESLVSTTALTSPDAVLVDGNRIDLPDYYGVYQDSEPLLYETLYSYARGTSDDFILEHSPDATNNREDQSGETTLIDQDHFPPRWTCAFTWTSDSKTGDKLPWVSSSTIIINENNHSLSWPPLTIYKHGLTPPRSVGAKAIPRYSMSYNGTTLLEPAYLELNTVCETTSAYAWGFSTALLFVFSLLSILFAWAMLLLDTDVYRHCRAARLKLSTNLYRDAIDLALELQSQLGDEVVGMPADQLLELVESKRGAMSLQALEYPDIPVSRTDEKTFGHLPGKIRSGNVPVEYVPLQDLRAAAERLVRTKGVPRKKVGATEVTQLTSGNRGISQH